MSVCENSIIAVGNTYVRAWISQMKLEFLASRFVRSILKQRFVIDALSLHEPLVNERRALRIASLKIVISARIYITLQFFFFRVLRRDQRARLYTAVVRRAFLYVNGCTHECTYTCNRGNH